MLASSLLWAAGLDLDTDSLANPQPGRRFLRWLEARIHALTKTQGILLALGAALILSLFGAYTQVFLHWRMFEEGCPLTLVSVIQLELCGLLAWMTYVVRMPESTVMSWPQRLAAIRDSRSLWLLLSAGFIFLGLDDLLMFHEIADKLVHFVFSIRETALTDRLDDVIQLGYGLGGVCVLVAYRRELWRYAHTLPFWLMGLACAFGMMSLDDLTSDRTVILEHFSHHPDLQRRVFEWAGLIAPPGYMPSLQLNETGKLAFNSITAIEEVLKTLGGAFFLAALVACLKSRKTHTPQGA